MQEDKAGKRLRDRVALITGGGRTYSIGRSIALRFATEGARLGVLDIDGESARWVADEIRKSGGEAVPLTCDITIEEQCHAAARELADTFGSCIDILANNAAALRGTLSDQSWRPFTEWEGPAFFLASSDSDFMTGQTLLVDGGLNHN